LITIGWLNHPQNFKERAHPDPSNRHLQAEWRIFLFLVTLDCFGLPWTSSQQARLAPSRPDQGRSQVGFQG
jgi:hypothetical protein